ncbi:MAG: peptidoglycan editing factor PgeF [Microscillaceae bacterium]|nr:peptidoglycan editing factor PgeF [Microscillaceae bacterium]
MKKIQEADLTYYQFNHLSQIPDIQHFVSSRQGGNSPQPWASMNISLHVNEPSETVIENRQKLASIMGTDLENFVFAKQTHSPNIALIDTHHRGSGVWVYDTGIANTDALITQQADICLVALGADCVPLLFYSPDNQVIASAHAGWRGTVLQIAQAVVQKMQNELGCDPAQIKVGIAPCISVRNYEIGTEVVEAVEQAFGSKEGYLWWNENTQKYHLDLVFANYQQLIAMGVQPQNIEVSGFCTYENSDIFYSARFDRGKTGRFGAGIMRKSFVKPQ